MSLGDLISHLSDRHRRVLAWFVEHAGQVVSWPGPLEIGPTKTLVATKAKGIYKPEWTQYAVSVKQTLSGPYQDLEPEYRADGSWVFQYFQENENLDARDDVYTNRALMKCIEDRIPVGVLRQVSPKPKVRYKVLGLALVTKWDAGYFHLESLPPHPTLEDIRQGQGSTDQSKVDSRGRDAPEVNVRRSAAKGVYIVKIAPGEGARFWSECLDGGYICVGWDEVGDLTRYRTKQGFDEDFRREFHEFHKGHSPTLARKGNELWTLRELQPGDKVIANRGTSEVLAIGEVIAPYEWHPERDEYKHTVRVNWDTSYAQRILKQPSWATTTVDTVPQELYDLITSQTVYARSDLAAVQTEFNTALKDSHVSFSDDLVRAFIAALATKRFVILTGLSGSGKTQIALRFGEWLGNRKNVIAVRPDWTGAEALFGYQNALSQDGSWYVPEALESMLQAAADKNNPYLLVLDEMNLAHVERYFADVLSGMESNEPCLPNLDLATRRPKPNAQDKLCFPDNLFIVGTVNVDETTYMFSPKVLDRANTFEFRVDPDDLSDTARKPAECEPGDPVFARSFLEIARDDDYHLYHPAPTVEEFTVHLRRLHRLLREDNFEFGHRVFYEAVRFSAMLAAAGDPDPDHALDRQIMQKVLPRLHGTRRRLEDTLCALGHFCFDLTYDPDKGLPRGNDRFDIEKADPRAAQLPLSFDKVRRMIRSLRANQFTSFTE